jgi:hypothetical protein
LIPAAPLGSSAVSGDETSFVQWRERAKDERKRSSGNLPLIIGIAAVVVVIVVVGIILLT